MRKDPVPQGDVKDWIHGCGATVAAIEGDTVDCPNCGGLVFTGPRSSRFAQCDLICTVDCGHCKGDHALVLDWIRRDRDSWQLLANRARTELDRYQYPGTPTYDELSVAFGKLLDERDEWLRGIADDARELERMLKVLRAAEAWFDAQTQETERMLMDAVDAYR